MESNDRKGRDLISFAPSDRLVEIKTLCSTSDMPTYGMSPGTPAQFRKKSVAAEPDQYSSLRRCGTEAKDRVAAAPPDSPSPPQDGHCAWTGRPGCRTLTFADRLHDHGRFDDEASALNR